MTGAERERYRAEACTLRTLEEIALGTGPLPARPAALSPRPRHLRAVEGGRR